MSDARYDYPKVNAIKIIIQSSSTKRILLLQEPETNEWMPLHWGLPGGKPIINESLSNAFERKMQSDIGQKLKPEGLFKIEELLQNGKTILMFVIVAKSENEFEPTGEAKSHKWVSENELGSMPSVQFTEYYNQKLLLDFIKNPDILCPIQIIETWDYNKMQNKDEYLEWLRSGERKN